MAKHCVLDRHVASTGANFSNLQRSPHLNQQPTSRCLLISSAVISIFRYHSSTSLSQPLPEATSTGYQQSPTFLVLNTEASEDSHKNEPSDSRVNSIAASYSNIFKAPTGGLSNDNAPNCVPAESSAVPPTRPAFRLSRAERETLEIQVWAMLEKGWIQPSSSTYRAPVLFAPKPDI
jgi:hypothetical protein